MGVARAELGHLVCTRVAADGVARRQRLGCHRARLRNGLLVGVARTSGRSRGRNRQLSGAAAGARQYQKEFGLEFPLIHGDAEQVPLVDGTFDLAISEYGASRSLSPTIQRS